MHDDTEGGRRLQELPVVPVSPIRVHLNFDNMVGIPQVVQVLKTIAKISANFFKNLLKVPQSDRIYYPGNNRCNNKHYKGNRMSVPIRYVTQGIEADYVLIVGTFVDYQALIASSVGCAYLR